MTGDIDRHEWKETVGFYLELKEEEMEMQSQQSDHLEFMRKLRAKKLEQLGLAGDAQARETIPNVVEEALPVAEGTNNDQGLRIVGTASDDVGMDIDA